MSYLSKVASAVVASALVAALSGATGMAAADPCNVCVQYYRMPPNSPSHPGPPPKPVCKTMVNRCLASKIPYHFRKPSPVQSKGSQIYRHFPSH